jgi:transposase-like protein
VIKIRFLGKNSRAYRKRYGKKRPELPLICENPGCNCRLHEHGCFWRIAVAKHGQLRIPIYRWRCPTCGRTVSVLPDFLAPWKHFVVPVREAAMKRRQLGQSFRKIARGVASAAIGGIHPRTIKRWWMLHLAKAGDAALWVAAELIRFGANEDLLRSHFRGVNPSPVDTVRWLDVLIQRYLHLLGFDHSLLRGRVSLINTRLPVHLRI